MKQLTLEQQDRVACALTIHFSEVALIENIDIGQLEGLEADTITTLIEKIENSKIKAYIQTLQPQQPPTL